MPCLDQGLGLTVGTSVLCQGVLIVPDVERWPTGVDGLTKMFVVLQWLLLQNFFRLLHSISDSDIMQQPCNGQSQLLLSVPQSHPVSSIDYSNDLTRFVLPTTECMGSS